MSAERRAANAGGAEISKKRSEVSARQGKTDERLRRAIF
jgi:hypothetical protein